MKVKLEINKFSKISYFPTKIKNLILPFSTMTHLSKCIFLIKYQYKFYKIKNHIPVDK